MRAHPTDEAEAGRFQLRDLELTKRGDRRGTFLLAGPMRRKLIVVASDGAGLKPAWEHVSVSVHRQPERTPTWQEMCWVKGLFWHEEECVVQFHPPESKYKHSQTVDGKTSTGVLHMWRKQGVEYELPPEETL